jgi:CBS domain-containing protein
MLVKDILSKKGGFVVTAGKDDSCMEAARKMNARRVGAVVVVEEEKVIGIFTERDILLKLTSCEFNPEGVKIGELMTTSVACCIPDTTIEECKAVMTNKRIRRLPVVENGKLVGIITIGDLLASEVAQNQETIEYLNQYIYGPYAGPEEVS